MGYSKSIRALISPFISERGLIKLVHDGDNIGLMKYVTTIDRTYKDRRGRAIPLVCVTNGLPLNVIKRLTTH
jgi:hypothetical protein